MNFEEWYNNFLKNDNQKLSSLSVKELLEVAFVAGMKHMEENTPLIAKDLETGDVVEIAKEDTFVSTDEKKFIPDELLEETDLSNWLKESKNAGK